MHAVVNNKIELVQLLMNRGADVDNLNEVSNSVFSKKYDSLVGWKDSFDVSHHE